MTSFNGIAPDGAGTPTEGVNPTTAQMEEGRSLPTLPALLADRSVYAPSSRKRGSDAMSDHTSWCDHRPDERHSARQPYCAKLLPGVLLIPEGSVRKAQLWASPTRAANLDGLTSDAIHAAETRYSGVELALEQWDGKKHRPAKIIRMSVEAARALAATLIQAADIQQGHITP